MTESFASPEIHHAKNVEDAIIMLDSRSPLTHQERKFITQSLYDLAFREGARQGRQAGVEHVYGQIRAKIAEFNPHSDMDRYTITVLESFLPVQEPVEYTDTTIAIRRQLEEKQRTRSQYTTTENFTAPWPER